MGGREEYSSVFMLCITDVQQRFKRLWIAVYPPCVRTHTLHEWGDGEKLSWRNPTDTVVDACCPRAQIDQVGGRVVGGAAR